jgi:uncharacterized protein (TIGR03083 family)
MVTETRLTLAEAHVQGFELVERHARRFTDYVSGLDAAALDRPVPDGSWTAGQTVTHVHSVLERYTTNLRRATSPAEVAVQNDEDIERLGVDVPASVAAIHEHLGFLRQVLPAIEPDREFPFHSGQQITLAGGWGNLIGELLAHGDDIARATGTTFPIPSPDTEVLWRFTAPLLQGWLRDTTAHDSWLLRFPFGPIGVTFDGADLRWDDEVPEPDREIVVADAAEFALVFPYRRRPAPDANVAELLNRFELL